MELLILLLQSDGKLVRRDVINRRLWGENAFQDSEHSVNTAVNKLRFILRDDPRDPRFIQTGVGQGYRFIAKVAVEPPPPPPAVKESPEFPALNGHGDATGEWKHQLLEVPPAEPMPPVLPPGGNTGYENTATRPASQRLLALVLVGIFVAAAAVA